MTSTPIPLTMACVSPDSAEWFQQVFTLAVSLRNFGGSLAGTTLHAFFVDSLDAIHSAPLHSIGVETSIVPSFPASRKQTNKLRMFEDAAARPRPGVLGAVDCDIAVLGDFASILTTSAVRATLAWESPLERNQWEGLLDALELRPAGTFVLPGSGAIVPVPYLNSGVLFVPYEMVPELTDAWIRYVHLLDPASPGPFDLPDGAVPYLDQVALACALAELGLPVELLGLEYNFHTRLPLPDSLDPVGPPRIAHYHGWKDDRGLLRPPAEALATAAIERLNAVVVARRGEVGPDRAPTRSSQLAGEARSLADQLVRWVPGLR